MHYSTIHQWNTYMAFPGVAYPSIHDDQPSLFVIIYFYLALCIHPLVGWPKYLPDINCFTWYYASIHRWAGQIFTWHHLFFPGIMHPSIGGLAKYLPDINYFYLALCIHPSVGWPNIHLTSFVFTWHYASIHRWAGQNVYMSLFVYTWHYASIHQWAGQNVLLDNICFYLALCIFLSVGWPKCLPDNIWFYLALCIHLSVGWPNWGPPSDVL